MRATEAKTAYTPASAVRRHHGGETFLVVATGRLTFPRVAALTLPSLCACGAFAQFVREAHVGLHDGFQIARLRPQ